MQNNLRPYISHTWFLFGILHIYLNNSVLNRIQTEIRRNHLIITGYFIVNYSRHSNEKFLLINALQLNLDCKINEATRISH